MDPTIYMDSDPLTAGVCDPHMNEGLTLQDMIDTDIKANFDDILATDNVNFSNMDTLDLLDTDLRLEDTLDSGNLNWGTFNSNTLSSYMDELPQGSNVMVNPNSIMPVSSMEPTESMVNQATPQVHVNQVRTANAINGNLSINTQYSNVQQQPQTLHSPALNSPVYPQQLQQLSPVIPQGFQAAAAGQPTIQLRPNVVRPTNVIPGAATMAKNVKVLPPNPSPMQQVPSAPHIGQPTVIQTSTNTSRKKPNPKQQQAEKENGYPKPGYSYSCLIALALKNSTTGHLSVSEIYKFMCEHFPYFKTAPAGWKNSVRHNLSLNKCFEKIEKPSAGGTNQRKGCLWAMNPAKINKMDEEVLKWSRKDPMAIKKGMVNPHTLEKLERGEMVKDYNANTTNNATNESEDEDDPKSPTSISSQSSSQGYDSAGSDFVDIEGFAAIPDSSLPELQLQASGAIFEDLPDERLQFAPVTTAPHVTVAHQAQQHIFTTAQPQQPQQQVVRLAQNGTIHQQRPAANHGFYPTAIHANYAITPAATAASTVTSGNGIKRQQTLVVTRQEGPQKVFTVGGPITS